MPRPTPTSPGDLLPEDITLDPSFKYFMESEAEVINQDVERTARLQEECAAQDWSSPEYTTVEEKRSSYGRAFGNKFASAYARSTGDTHAYATHHLALTPLACTGPLQPHPLANHPTLLPSLNEIQRTAV